MTSASEVSIRTSMPELPGELKSAISAMRLPSTVSPARSVVDRNVSPGAMYATNSSTMIASSLALRICKLISVSGIGKPFTTSMSRNPSSSVAASKKEVASISCSPLDRPVMGSMGVSEPLLRMMKVPTGKPRAMATSPNVILCEMVRLLSCRESSETKVSTMVSGIDMFSSAKL